MISASTLIFTEEIHRQVRMHLFPGDGFEAAAVLICSRGPGPHTRLLFVDVVLVPHDQCRRERDLLIWPGSAIEDAIDLAESDDLSLILIHSHPGDYYAFSTADDQSDLQTMPGLFQALGPIHGSAVMMPDGAVRARVYSPDMAIHEIELVSLSGHDIRYWWRDDAYRRRPVAFTSDMTAELSRLTACVIGVSGTGSIVAEQAARLGFGNVILIDFDKLEARNLNRIINATSAGAASAILKVVEFAQAICSYRGADVAIPIASSITSRDAVIAAAKSDIIFSCVDTLEARATADLLSSSFLIPLIDVGVSIPTREAGYGRAIADACGRIDFVRPGGPTLGDRQVYSAESLRAEYMRNAAPEDHLQEVNAGYIRGLVEEAPSVISLNMRAGSASVLEYISRAYPFRHDPNANFARSEFSVAAGDEEAYAESRFHAADNHILARGCKEPLLGLPSLRPPQA